jgi:hypothetical protein
MESSPCSALLHKFKGDKCSRPGRTPYAGFEIDLRREDAERHGVEMLLKGPDRDARLRLTRSKPSQDQTGFDQLREIMLGDEKHDRALAESLFAYAAYRAAHARNGGLPRCGARAPVVVEFWRSRCTCFGDPCYRQSKPRL